jgi:hypothetical protein
MLVVDPVRLHECQGFLLAVLFHELDPDNASEEESTRLPANNVLHRCLCIHGSCRSWRYACHCSCGSKFDQKAARFY